MQQYETVIILTPLLSEEALKEVVTKFTKLLKDGGAEIIQEDNWGLKKLAYPIQKKTTGYYHLTEFKAPGEIISKLELEYKRDERIMRFLTVSLDKHATVYNERKRGGAFNKKKPAVVREEPVEAAAEVKPRRVTKGGSKLMAKEQIQYVTAPKVEDNRKKYCRFRKNGIKYIDYKDANFLLKFINDQGKVLPRRLTGTSLKFQRKVAQAVKRARHIGLLPYVTDSLK